MSFIRGRGFKKIEKASEALNKLKNYVKFKSSFEEVLLEDAYGRVLAEDVVSKIDVPSFDKSAMDGYAVIAEDTYEASVFNPIPLKIVGKNFIGEEPKVHLNHGETVEVSTGSPLPKNANAVVLLEWIKKISEDLIEVYHTVHPWENVTRIGDDLKQGEVVLKKGVKLLPQDVGVLKVLGLEKVKVVKKPKVALISTGDELVESVKDLKPFKVIDVNKPILSGMIIESCGEPLNLGLVKDDFNEIKMKIKEALEKADIIVLTGGTSVGEKDLVPDAINSLGFPGVISHGIAIRPGGATCLAVVNEKPIFGLSGYPVAAIIGFKLFVKPLIRMFLGSFEDLTVKVKVKVARRIPSPPGIKSFVRVIVKKTGENYLAEPISTSGSGILSSMVKANAIIEIPEESEGIEEGEEVEAWLFRAIEGEKNEFR
ncbi:molybdopterin molybdotransferase MoeA [Candidatus Bathyarchaeota archaeon]|nr:molybdopterin molybdotransferase MoeA [Candidatus Bathyarchaeota archaeon]